MCCCDEDISLEAKKCGHRREGVAGIKTKLSGMGLGRRKDAFSPMTGLLRLCRLSLLPKSTEKKIQMCEQRIQRSVAGKTGRKLKRLL